jgi:hypothetical protein
MTRLKQAAAGAMLAALFAAPAAQSQPPPVIPFPKGAAPPMPGEPPAAAAGCAPSGLFRAVVRNVTPGLAAADRGAQPRTLYRQGSRWLRNEEQPDLGSGNQLLVVIAEPDLWVLNQATRQGQHSIDPGPDLTVHAPILSPSADLPAPFATLEYGCEAEFVARFAPTPQRTAPWGATLAAVHGVTIGEHTLAILMDDRRGAPLLISYLRQGRPVLVVRYDEYRQALQDNPPLFAPPSSYHISEAKAPPPPSH